MILGYDTNHFFEHSIKMTVFCENISLQVTKDHRIELKQSQFQSPAKGEVLVNVRATGICGSDIHFWKTGAIGDLKVEGNCVLGHEAAGEVLEVGEGVENVKPGDRVSLEPGVPCGKCFLCSQGDYNLCEDVKFIGVYPHHGSMQKYLTHDARFVHKLPENMSYAQGALVEPVSVAYHGIERAQLKLGEGVLISGAGPIGLVALALAKASGCTPLCITDLSAERLEFAKSLVPEVKTFQIDLKSSPRETAKGIRKLFGADEVSAPHVTLECTGVESSIVTGAFVTRRSGTLMVIGVGRDTINNFPFMHLSLAEIDVKFINRYHDSWPAVIRLISNGVINVDLLISHRFPLEQAVEAMSLSSDPTRPSIKVLVEDQSPSL